jgi:hypothetical protein
MQVRSFVPFFAGLAIGTAVLTGSLHARTPFDGSWSVLVITESGNCDRAYRYAVNIQNGVLRYSGDAGINLSGRVDAGGRLQVTVGRGSQSASGTGRLSASSGSGTWRGRSSQQQCGGRWEAERR